jgi:UDP-glucose:glycoprotein glucosyltransferase
VVGPIGKNEFVSADFRALESYELRKRVQPVLTAIEDVIPDYKNLDRCVCLNKNLTLRLNT